MSHFPHGAFIAIHAAQEQRRREEEEETMTQYSLDDLEHNYEFKIVRSEMGAFRKQENFQRLLQEESMAGWELLEKLDDRRVRFKRPWEARRRDLTLPPGYDPYRTAFDRSSSRAVILVLVALVMMIGVIVSILVSAVTSETATVLTVLGLGIAVMVILFTLIVIARRKA